MDKRKEAILRAITDDYIETAEPVGSRTIARKYGLGVSPATIRNDMADLEESGYLQQPHTSAGRIPSDKGYRFYVDVLMPRRKVTPDEMVLLRQHMQTAPKVVEEMVRSATRLLAALTRYAGVAMTPSAFDSAVRAVQFIPFDEHHVLIVMVTEPGFVQNRIVEVVGIAPETLVQAGRQITHYLQGKTLREVTLDVRHDVAAELSDAGLFQVLMEMLLEGLEGSAEKVFLEGSINLIEYPEFREIEKAKALLCSLEERDRLLELVTRTDGEASVAIGEENQCQEMRECSVITAAYDFGGRAMGTVGVIGPTRMEYTRAVALVQSIADTLSEALNDMIRP